MAMWESKEVVLCLDNQQITGKNVVVKSFNIERHCSRDEMVRFRDGRLEELPSAQPPVEITIELLCCDHNFSMEFWDDGFKPKIKNKKVDDCSIQELLFAVREKIKGEKNGNEN